MKEIFTYIHNTKLIDKVFILSVLTVLLVFTYNLPEEYLMFKFLLPFISIFLFSLILTELILLRYHSSLSAISHLRKISYLDTLVLLIFMNAELIYELYYNIKQNIRELYLYLKALIRRQRF